MLSPILQNKPEGALKTEQDKVAQEQQLNSINKKIGEIAQSVEKNPQRYTSALHSDLKSLAYALIKYESEFGNFPKDIKIPPSVKNLITEQLKSIDSKKVNIEYYAPDSAEKNELLNNTLPYVPALYKLLNKPLSTESKKLLHDALASTVKGASIVAQFYLSNKSDPAEIRNNLGIVFQNIARSVASIDIYAKALGKEVQTPIQSQIKKLDDLSRTFDPASGNQDVLKIANSLLEGIKAIDEFSSQLAKKSKKQ